MPSDGSFGGLCSTLQLLFVQTVMKVEQGGKDLLLLLPLHWTRSDLQNLIVGIYKMVDAIDLKF